MWKKLKTVTSTGLDGLSDVDVTNKTNGYILQYNATSQKFESRPLPTGAGFTYVNLDKIAEEIVETYEPENITNLQFSNVGATSCTLSWTASTSSDIKDYRIYLGSALVGTTNLTTFAITGLSVNTNNLLVVKSRNNTNYESYGTKIIVKTTGLYAYQVSTTGYVKLPTISFDAIEIVCNPTKTASGYYFDGRDGNPNAVFSKNSIGFDGYGFSTANIIDKLIVDGITKVSGGSANGVLIPINTKQTIRLEMFQAITDDANIFSDKNGSQLMTGLIYSVKVYKSEELIAYYDLTESFTGTTITDKSGRGNSGTLGANSNHFIIG